MAISERINNWIEDRRIAWGESLGEFLLGAIAKGATKTVEDMEPGIIDQVGETIRKLIDNPATPPETKRMLEKALNEGNIFHAVMGWILTVIGLIPALFGLGGPLGNVFNHVQELSMRSQILDPELAIRAWRRDPGKYEKFIQDLRHGGWSEDRIEAWKFITLAYPPVPDMVRFADFGSFDPEVIAKWREFYDAPGWITEPFKLIGIINEPGRDWANKYWFSHWVQPGRFELGEMYRRGLLGKPLIGKDEVGGVETEGEAEEVTKLAYRTMGYSSFWQDRLLELVREVPTRVDVRRWWDMRTIDEAELREIYQRRGYFGKDEENYVVWTKVYVAFPDLLARWQNGWITLDQVKEELTGYGMPPARVEELIQTRIKSASPARTIKERDLTLTDLYKGIKQGRITRGEGLDLIMDMGYDEDEAQFKIDVNIPRDLEDQVVEQRQLSKGDIRAGLKAEALTTAEARVKLLELRYSPADTDLLLRIFEATIKPPTEPRQKEASKADIIKGVKAGVITPEEGYLMLQDIDYSPEAAQFILSVQVESSPFSPVNYQEFKDRTAKYRSAAGMEGKTMTEELKQAAVVVVRLTDEVKSLQDQVREEEDKFSDLSIAPEETTKRLTELRLSLNWAQVELSRAQTAYNAQLAAWRHGG